MSHMTRQRIADGDQPVYPICDKDRELNRFFNVLEDSPKMLILEYCERGSLDALLPLLTQMDLTNCNTLQSGEQLSMGGDEHEMLNKQVNNPASIGGGAGSAGVFASSQQITHILRGVACGMHYLADEGYIHKVNKINSVKYHKNKQLVCPST